MKKRLLAAAAAVLFAVVALIGTSPTTAMAGNDWESVYKQSFNGNDWE